MMLFVIFSAFGPHLAYIFPFYSLIKTDRKQMLLFNDSYTTVSGHIFAICMFIFHKPEVQTVILICSTGLNFNWFKSYGLKHGLWTPNEGINQRYLKNWADVADKICFGRT